MDCHGQEMDGRGLLTTMGKLERQDAALVEMQLVFVRLGDVQHFHVTVLHAHGQPFSGWAVAQRKDLRVKQFRLMVPGEDTLPLAGGTASSEDTI